MDDLTVDFLTEINENLEDIDRDLEKLRRKPDDKKAIARISRRIASVPDQCRIIGLPRLESAAHETARILKNAVRKDVPALDIADIEEIAISIDAVKHIVAVLGSTGSEPKAEAPEIEEQKPEPVNQAAQISAGSPQPVLIVGAGGCRFAIPQINVHEIVMATGDQADLRLVNGSAKALPATCLSSVLAQRGGWPDAETMNAYGIIMQDASRNFALRVAEVFDTEDVVFNAPSENDPSIYTGRAVIDGEIVMLLDTAQICTAATGDQPDAVPDAPQAATEVSAAVVDINDHIPKKDWYAENKALYSNDDKVQSQSAKSRLLLADHSPFFRSTLASLLRVSGYDVTITDGPLQALKLHEDGAVFDVIMADIESPVIEGPEFARMLKNISSARSTPLLGLCTQPNPESMDRCIEAGFIRCVVKFDKDTILRTLLSMTRANTAQAQKTAS